MSAPAALAMSKLSYPETEISKGSSKDFDKLEKSYVVNPMLTCLRNDFVITNFECLEK